MTIHPPASRVTPAIGSATAIQVGTLLGKYLLTDRLGQGGSGEVFLAHHQTLNIPVAIKVLRARGAAPQFAEQLRSEACILAQLNHPHLVRVTDFEDHPQTPYLVMEYVNGSNLAELIDRSGRIRRDRALEIVLQVADGLAAAHRHHIVHRDVKPANILLTRAGSAKLADLGQAVIRRLEGGGGENGLGMVGTPPYMPPEQFDPAGEVDARSDVYSLGVTFYQALTGQLPYVGSTAAELMLLHKTQRPVPPHELNRDLSPRWSEVILTMMAADANDRFSDCEEVIAELRELRQASSQGLPIQQETQTLKRNDRLTKTCPVVPREMLSSPRPVAATPAEPTPAQGAARALQEGIAAARAGKKEQARLLLLEATAFEPNNENAWLWLASVSVTPQECLACAERVLAINPTNRQALQWQEKCKAQFAKAAPRKCPFCQAAGTSLEAMCEGCGAILGLQDVELIFNAAPLADTARIVAVARRCESAVSSRPEFPSHYLLGLAYLNLQEFARASEQFDAASRLRGSDLAFSRHLISFQKRLAEFQQTAPAPDLPPTQKTILAIDDSPTVCKLVASVLGKYDYRVLTAPNGRQGVELLQSEAVDLVLLDIMMPEVDGLQLCKMIRADKTTATIPVVFLSGKDGLLTKLWARMAGSSAFVTKPFKHEELVQVVEKFCRR